MTHWYHSIRSMVVMRQLSIKHWTFQLLLLAMIAGSQQIGMSHLSNDGDVTTATRSRRYSNANNDYGYYHHDANDVMNRIDRGAGNNNNVDSNSHNNVQCPSFTDNSACPCYKFEDGEYHFACIRG